LAFKHWYILGDLAQTSLVDRYPKLSGAKEEEWAVQETVLPGLGIQNTE